MDLFDIQHRNSLLGHTSNIIQHYPLHHDRSFLCMICIYIYINHITILCMYTCSIQFDPPAGPFTPNCHFASCLLMWQYQRWRRRPEEWPPMVHTWCSGSTHAPECHVPLPSTRPTWSIYGTVFVHFIYDVLKLEGLIHDFLSSILEGYWIQLKFLVSKLTYLYLGTTKKRRNLSTLGSGCKKKVPLYVAPWRCRNVVLRS